MGKTTSKMLFENLSLNNLSWNEISGYIKQDRKRDESLSFLLNQKCICKSEWDKENVPSNCKKITLKKRLGSSSMAGEVYLLETGEHKFVAKILPIINDSSREENENEIKIATKASNLVLQGKSDYFPIVYGSGECPDTHFDQKTSNFYDQTDKYFYREFLANKINSPALKKRFKILTKSSSLTKQEIRENFDKITSNNPVKDFSEEDYKISSHILLSELAWGDLGQFMTKLEGKLTEAMWNNIVKQILYTIDDMQEKLGIVHQDLHQGNFLVQLMFYNEDLYTNFLIHDFGKAKIIDKWDEETRKLDVEKILEILFNKTPYKTIKNKIEKLESIIESHKDSSPLIPKLINYWDNLLL